ncbi:AraC-like DNA-binding protein/mannose-6-phosphate isomerase-like protein (cupin superfamily) [Anaerotaenia torta]|uniref:AraC family transcriptional regulator n=1 Tax=Anaerotaenia torta TaxID=433293 RepID=UPI003D1D9FAA
MKPEAESIFKPDILKHWLEIRRYYAINYTHFEMKPHSHPELEIMYAVHGSCKIICRNKDREMVEYSLKEGEYIFLNCNTPHQLEVVRGIPCRILNLEIALTSPAEDFHIRKLYEISPSVRDFFTTSFSAFKAADHGSSLHRIITELQKQFMNGLDQSEHCIEVNLLLSQLLVELSRQKGKRFSSHRGSIYVRKALSYIEKSFDKDLSVEEVALATGVSISHLQRLFKEQTGASLVDKINEYRINKARLLLENSCLPVIDIAFTVGFHNRQHFTYIFTKTVGCSPALYRKQKGNNQHLVGF